MDKGSGFVRPLSRPAPAESIAAPSRSEPMPAMASSGTSPIRPARGTPSDAMPTLSPTPQEALPVRVMPPEGDTPSAKKSSDLGTPTALNNQESTELPTKGDEPPEVLTPIPSSSFVLDSNAPTAAPERLPAAPTEHDNTANTLYDDNTVYDELSPTASPESFPPFNNDWLASNAGASTTANKAPKPGNSKSAKIPSTPIHSSIGTIAIVERAREHASTRWNREHPNGMVDSGVHDEATTKGNGEKKTEHGGSTRWEREHNDPNDGIEE